MGVLLLRLMALLSVVFGMVACGGAGASGDTEAGGGQSEDSLAVEVLSSGSYQDRYGFQRLRLSKAGRRTAYAIWFPAPQATAAAKAAAVLMTDPYAGIDWTGEAVDQEAFQRANSRDFVMIEDRYGPYADTPPSIYTPYDYSDIDNAAGGAVPYLMNGIGVIVVYQRFYAGGSAQDHIDMTRSALEFLKTRPEVDVQRVGVWGSSYGGSLALYAAATAPAGVVPVFGALSTPLVDYEQFVPYADLMEATYSDRGKAILRLEPFRRRAVAAATPASAAASAAADYTPYATATVVSRLKTKFLFIHDYLDTISPLAQTSSLYFGNPGRHQVFIYPHQDVTPDWNTLDIAHAPVKPGFDEASAILFSQSYLLTRLVNADRQEILLPRLVTLDLSMFTYLRTQQGLGYDASTFLLPRLLELCDPRIRLVDYDDGFSAKESGPHFVARILQTYWSLSVDESNVLSHLQSKGLSP